MSTQDPAVPPPRPHRTSSPSAGVEPGQRRVLEVLQREGPLAIEALEARLGLSRTAISRRLTVLGQAGLVTRHRLRHGIGRPVHLYDVTPDARSGSSPGYGRLAAALIDGTRAVGGDELLARVLDVVEWTEAVAIRDRADAEGLAEAPLPARVRCLARILDERGYAADVTDERGLRLVAHACPLLDLARRSPMVCDSELRLVGLVLGALVERESNIGAGGRACAYRIRAREPGFPATVWTSGQMRPTRPGEPSVSSAPGTAWTSSQMRAVAPHEPPARPEPAPPWSGSQWAGRTTPGTQRPPHPRNQPR